MSRRYWWRAVLIGLLLALVGCDTLSPPTATPVPPTITPPPTATPLLPSPTSEPATPLPDEATPTASPRPSPTRTVISRRQQIAPPTPTVLPSSPAVLAILRDTYANMAALPGYAFTETIGVKDFNRPVDTAITGTYARPDRLRWTTDVGDSSTQAVIVGQDYVVSLDDQTWTQVSGASAALDQYLLWRTLPLAQGANVTETDNPDSPLTHLFYEVDPARLPLAPQTEPWLLSEVGVWIGRDDHLLYRLDLAAQTADYLLEEHVYFAHLGTSYIITLPTDATPTPDASLTPDAALTP